MYFGEFYTSPSFFAALLRRFDKHRDLVLHRSTRGGSKKTFLSRCLPVRYERKMFPFEGREIDNRKRALDCANNFGL